MFGWPVTQAIESQIANGGLAQLLWNSFPNWRELIDDGIRAYEWLELPEHAEALREFRQILEKAEATCRPYIKRAMATQNFDEFRKWLAAGELGTRSDKVKLFWSNRELDTKKDAILKRHLKEVLSRIKSRP